MVEQMEKKLTAEQLEEHLTEFVSKDNLRLAMMQLHNDGEYIVATNGHVMVVIDLKVHPQFNVIGKPVIDYPVWRGIIPDDYDNYKPISVDDFITDESALEKEEQFETIKCSKCDGEGELNLT